MAISEQDIANAMNANVSEQEPDILEGINRTIPPQPSTLLVDKAKNQLDKYYDIQIRVAQIENPQEDIISVVDRNPLDISHTINDNTGQVCLRFNDLGLGFMNPDGAGEKLNSMYDYDPKMQNEYAVTNVDSRPNVGLTYPFIFVGTQSWCGFNYLPPVGSKVLVGFGKNHKPFILGFLAEQYKFMRPILHPGEIMIKGYGNNYIHWRWSNKLDIVAGGSEGEIDRDDAAGGKTIACSNSCMIQLDADNGQISLLVNGTGLVVGGDGVHMRHKTSSIDITDEGVSTLTTGSISMDGAAMDKHIAKESSNPGSKK